ncbi:hypothetical protein SS50377_22421 [Spironucleus salmonicida]|uniref:Uncharacterized protein n=1 Tax=Spironucleus salmonicida TaxID=348837 RepID=V6LCV8_9EUKA|nr:hypothetical protein SS50377_22421 [Spironucleus salmonicida]|eukprot:EST42088.1 Hypothetical protein SS50377_18395 [Spironucleus salmonicida]
MYQLYHYSGKINNNHHITINNLFALVSLIIQHYYLLPFYYFQITVIFLSKKLNQYVLSAFKLVTGALKTAATNENGVLDMRLLEGGEKGFEDLNEAVKAYLKKVKSCLVHEIFELLKADGLNSSVDRLDQCLQGLVDDQIIRRSRDTIVLIE